MFGRKFSAYLWLGLLTCTLVIACGDKKDRVLSGLEPQNLFDALETASFEGLAQELARDGVVPQEKTLLSLDFEQGTLAPLSPFGGFGVAARKVENHISVSADKRSWKGTKSVRLSGPADYSVTLRTKPLPVSDQRTYKLSYRIATEKLPYQSGSEYGQIAVTAYKLGGMDQEKAVSILANRASEKKARLSGPKSFWVPHYNGNTPWTYVEDTFWVDRGTTHIVLSVILSRPEKSGKAHRAKGTVWYDDIVLKEIEEPLYRRYQVIDQGALPAHPLKAVVDLGHRAFWLASDMKYGIYAPAPSVIAFPINVPEDPMLSFGYGVFPRKGTGENLKKVSFEVAVIDEKGKTHSIFRQPPPDLSNRKNRWERVHLSLREFSGQKVTLRLITHGRAASESSEVNLTRLPEAGMVWSYPVVSSNKYPGKTVVLVGIDTLPAKRCSLYGYKKPTTPHLEAIADEGVTFLRALTSSPWTLPSFSSILTGLETFEHRAGESGKTNIVGKEPLEDSVLTLAERLRKRGWETSAWVNNPYFDRMFGTHQGFSRYFDYGTRSTQNASNGAVEDLLEYLVGPSGHNRFLFIHFMDPHGPYLPNEQFKEKWVKAPAVGRLIEEKNYELYNDICFKNLKLTDEEKVRYKEFYEAMVAYTDHQVGRIFAELKRMSDPDRLLFIVTADHGEELWDHGLYEHGHTLFDEQLRVPLVVYGPGEIKKGRKVAEAVAVHDVAPTILEFAGIDPPAKWLAKSLLPYLKDSSPQADRVLFSSNLLYGVQRLAVEKNGYKYIYNQTGKGSPYFRSPKPPRIHQLFDLQKDPQEKQNVFSEEQERGLALHSTLVNGFLPLYEGSYVLFVDAGKLSKSGRHVFEGVLSLKREAVWKRGVQDFIWPKTDGSDGHAVFRYHDSESENVLRFKLDTPKALVGFRVERGSSPLKVELRLNGVKLQTKSMVIGSKRGHPESMPFVIEADERESFSTKLLEKLLAKTSDEPRVVVIPFEEVKKAGGRRGADSDGQRIREELRSLGYVS